MAAERNARLRTQAHAHVQHDADQPVFALGGRCEEQLRNAVEGMDSGRLNTPYREGGWTVRQLVHHIADSHMNAYNRVGLALTADWPVIFAYQESRWAELEDARTLPVSVSLDLLEALHVRWVRLFASLQEPEWKRGYNHPENGRQSVDRSNRLDATARPGRNHPGCSRLG